MQWYISHVNIPSLAKQKTQDVWRKLFYLYYPLDKVPKP